MKKNIFTLLTLLVCAVGSAWANQTELISGITLPDIPTNTLDVSDEGVTKDANGWYVMMSPKTNLTTQNWYKGIGTNGGSASFTIPTGTTAPYTSGEQTINRYTVQSGGRAHAIRFTGVEIASFLGNYNNDSRKTHVSVFSYVGTTQTQTLIETKSVGSGIGELVFSGLSTSTTYIAYIYGNSTSNSDFYGFALKVPSAPAKAYTVTAETNNSNYGTAAADASSLDQGETTKVTATPKSGYQFVSWAVEGTGATLSSTKTNPTTLTMGTANATVTATFSAINYTITHDAATGGTYTISVAGGAATDANTTATIGQTITLAGTPTDPAHTYVAWNVKDADDNDVSVTDNQFTMPASNVTIAPVFSKPLNTLFSMTSITAIVKDSENNKMGTVTATISDGSTVEVFNNKGDADGLLYNNSINLNGSGSSYIHITLPNNVTLQAGDVITATFLGGSDTWKLSKTASGASSKANPYTIAANDALLGATELYIFKDASAQVSALKIEGQGEISDLTVTSSATPTVAMGATSNITYTSSSTGAVTYTSDDESVATVSNTGVITGVFGGTATITISQEADATYRAGVAKVTVTVPETALVRARLTGNTTATMTGSISATYSGKTQDVDATVGGCKLGSQENWTGFTLDGDNTLQTGDIVEVKISQRNGSTPFVFYDSKEQTNTLLTTTVDPEPGVYRFALPEAANGKKGVFLVRGKSGSTTTGTENTGFNPHVVYIALYRPDVALLETADSYTPVAATDVTVSLNRTLSASYYNTFCVPFDIDLTDENSPLYGADVQEYDNVTGSILKFKAVTGTMDAGTPYLVKPAANVVNPVFTGVTVKEVESTTVSIANSESPGGNFQFKGTYNKVTLATDKTEQFLNTSGTFSYPSDAEHATMKGLRAYFIIPAAVIGSGAPELSISFDGGENGNDNTTVIDGIEYKTVEDGEYYNLAGQRVAQPTKGLYIVNGRKVVVK